MWKYAIRKLLLALPVLLGITIIDYAIMCMAGSPLDMMISPRATQEAIAAKAQQLGVPVITEEEFLKMIGEKH